MSREMDRIHLVLDGDLPRAALTSAEEARLREVERALAHAAATLREAPSPDLAARVLAALPDEHSAGDSAAAPQRREARSHAAAAPLRALWDLLWSPVRVPLRPAYVVLAAAVVLLASAVLIPSDPEPVVLEAAGDAEAQLYVQFRIEVPGAADVALAGSFTGWRAEHHLTEVAPGVWSIMLPLSPGVHDYAFVVDGKRMIVDPYAPAVADPFGGSNSRLFLPAPNGSA